MSGSTEKLQHELEDAQRTIAELQTKLESHEAGYRLTTLELEENRSALLFMLEDLEAGRKKIEQAHQEWMAALDVISDPIFLHDENFHILRCNKAYWQCAGIPFDQIIGRPYYEIFPKAAMPLHGCLRAMEKAEEEEEEEEEEVAVGDAIYRSRAFSIHDKQGAYLHSVHVLEDITESRRIEAALAESEEKFHTLYESSHDAMMTAIMEKGFIGGNPAALAMFGCRSEQEFVTLTLAGVSPEFQPDGRKSADKAQEMMRLAMENGSHFFEWMHKRVNESEFPAEVLLMRANIGGKPVIQATVRDISERKQAEAAVQQANRAHAALSEVNRMLVRVTDENKLLQSICRSIVEQRGYRFAWVCYVQHDADKAIRIVAYAGSNEGFLDIMPTTWAESGGGMGIIGRVILSGTTQLCRDIANDPQCTPWRDAALQRGYAAEIALPLTRRSGEVFGVLHVYAADTNAFIPVEVGLLEEMAGDLAFGIRSLHIRRQRDLAQEQNRQQLVQLESNLEDTVRAIATIVEMRDPYTAGHQARVADLAAAIARQMGLPEEQVHGIHLAGLVHDLGKIRIPAEILSKPGRISDIERSLIGVHPQAGYEILKGIDFPWPIAQMVLQHHERFDGSGYPQGLKGEQIIVGACILGVADVVEAMSSHRPYRPSLGIEVALEEISRQRGVYYDSQVTDACLAVFREGYRFK